MLWFCEKLVKHRRVASCFRLKDWVDSEVERLDISYCYYCYPSGISDVRGRDRSSLL